MGRSCHLSFVLIAAVALSSCSSSAPPPNESDVTSVIEAFYGAMKKGDAAGAMTVIAPDAVFLESGKLETRAEYEMNHLPSDIEFESQVSGKRGPMRVTFDGNTAWVIAMTDYDGKFQGDPVSFVSAQLVVLTRDSGKWMIRSIHWSSRRT
ncbi:MAG TPA: nuclear transport factor 2 family protein [Vicinamibacterales bacterium]|nr:nuclear transport factor 2 family protein [Vicinamibacterales bacterium]